ncbi:hypothetical protein V8E53_012327 [Lactarius tabidus]
MCDICLRFLILLVVCIVMRAYIGLDSASLRVGYHTGTPSRGLYRASTLEHPRRGRGQHPPVRRTEQASNAVCCHRRNRRHLP